MSVPVSIVPKGTRSVRTIRALAHSMRHTESGEPSEHLALAFAEQQEWRDTPSVIKALQGWQTKAAVAAGTTTTSGYAAELAVPGVWSEVAELVRDVSISGALLARGARRTPLNVTVPRETAAAASDWVAEGRPTPMRAGAHATTTLSPFKAACLIVLTSELTMISHPDAEATLKQSIVLADSWFIDRQLLDNTVAASAGVRPASLTYNGTKITSTGTTAAQITADLDGMTSVHSVTRGG